MLTSKLEVLVDLGPKPDEKIVQKTLSTLKSQDGVKEAVFRDGAFMVETTLPNQRVLDLVANTSGRRTVLQGFGESESAVAIISSQDCCSHAVRGVIRFQQVGDSTLIVDGSADGLTPGPHSLHVAESGDLSEGCKSIGGHYNPAGSPHGSPAAPPGERHAGDLGNIVADAHGRTAFRVVDNVLKVSEIIGRAIAITERGDDLGKGSSPNSKVDGDAGPPIACGIIARSAGIFQNPKRICQCDGVVVWDEKDRPLAGRGRRGDKGDVEGSNGDVKGLNGAGDHKGHEGKTCCKF